MARVVLAMSGGVDSSVAAYLLQQQGHDVFGVFMRHGHQSPVACRSRVNTPSPENKTAETDLQTASNALPILQTRLDHKQGCCTAADAEDARRVADKLDIPFYALNLDAEFAKIIDYFVDEYTNARTPNPCVVCNQWIKFGKLFQYANSIDAAYVATGHYARMKPLHGADSSGEMRLFRGIDNGKDQSYALFGIEKRFLSRMLLPVGEFEKPAIRRMAVDLGLRVADKPDSQEICFVTEGRYNEFVRAHRTSGETSGEILTTDGRVVGEHGGIEGFTIGQRKKLGVALGRPQFVVRIDSKTRQVVIGDREELYRSTLVASRFNWHDEIFKPTQCQVQIRYNAPAVPAIVKPLTETSNSQEPSEKTDRTGRFQIDFDKPQFSVTPGQAVVCYEKNRLLGGGWID